MDGAQALTWKVGIPASSSLMRVILERREVEAREVVEQQERLRCLAGVEGRG
jgi:hypothetical protein